MRELRMVGVIGVGLAAVVLQIGMAGADEFELEKGYNRLDNGKDLTGWTGDLAGWSVVEGAIHLDAKKAKGNIYSEVAHSRNCIIRMQFRASERADSGVSSGTSPAPTSSGSMA